MAQQPSFKGYTFIDDMASHAIVFMLRSVLKFDANKSQNPYAYLVQCGHGAFANYISTEKRQWNIKADLEERIKNGQVD
jgi:DNA-directed RNA polymerase specialized sigma subunit